MPLWRAIRFLSLIITVLFLTVQLFPADLLPVEPSISIHRNLSLVPERAVDFELRDQYNQVISYRFPKSKPTILIFGDRKGSEQIEGWVKPIWAQYQERVDQRGVAVLSAVPSFMRGIIRSMFKSRVKYPVLLDWTGEVAKSYSYKSGQANLILIDQQGQVVLRLNGGADKDGLKQLYAKIDRLLTIL
jgi:cytochrome oxidase Cu insertion factor (SCO1/SenC/PrrC family)